MAILYQAIAIANWFIEKNLNDNSNLTHLKIQKLLYYIQGWYLAYFDCPLFEDNIEAWKYGPVIDSIYRSLRRYRDKEINKLIRGYAIINGIYTITKPKVIFNNEKEEDFILSFWNEFSKIPPWDLVNDTHKENTPWYQVSLAYENKKTTSKIIPVELMKSYFKSLLTESPTDRR
ncbi:MAG: DUF4065 domain-containing protein [Deltaproteobacteria bacterium]|jgi:uncharacterized phage-associated protein|nr:DUF4065 domain-containing protein [Deltaproteobacteria bacterium]